MSNTTRLTRLGLGLLSVAALAACSGASTGPTSSEAPDSTSNTAPTGTEATKPNASATDSAPASEPSRSDTLTVVTHESFALPDELLEKFESEQGMKVKISTPGDGGELVNQLILTKDSPLGDVVFGIDNTFSNRATAEGVIESYDSPALPRTSSQFDVPDLNPIDFGDVCLNADKGWFKEKGTPVPTTLDDLTKPEYKDLLVVSNPASSSPGLAFLAATVGAKGDGWLDYWGQLKDNGVKVVPGWSEAYYTEFSAGEGKGAYPLVLSYATSPAFTVTDDGKESTTEALLGTCFRQVEYAGVIKGASNEAGARAFIDFLLSPEVQASIPENMYMYPVVTETKLPEEWVKFAPLSQHPIDVAPEEIAANRDTWIKEWTAKVIG